MRLSDEAEACRRQPGQTTNMEKMDKQVMNNNKPRLVEDSLDRQTTNKETRQTGTKNPLKKHWVAMKFAIMFTFSKTVWIEKGTQGLLLVNSRFDTKLRNVSNSTRYLSQSLRVYLVLILDSIQS